MHSGQDGLYGRLDSEHSMYLVLNCFLSGPQLSLGKQEAFEIFIRDHEDHLTVEDNKNLLKQRSVTSRTSTETVVIHSHPACSAT